MCGHGVAWLMPVVYSYVALCYITHSYMRHAGSGMENDVWHDIDSTCVSKNSFLYWTRLIFACDMNHCVRHEQFVYATWLVPMCQWHDLLYVTKRIPGGIGAPKSLVQWWRPIGCLMCISLSENNPCNSLHHLTDVFWSCLWSKESRILRMYTLPKTPEMMRASSQNKKHAQQQWHARGHTHAESDAHHQHRYTKHADTKFPHTHSRTDWRLNNVEQLARKMAKIHFCYG